VPGRPDLRALHSLDLVASPNPADHRWQVPVTPALMHIMETLAAGLTLGRA